MTQTEKDQNAIAARRGRPGQRQQERLMRLARRRRRQRIAISCIIVVLLLGVTVAGYLQYQKYNADQQALQDKHATATANAQNVHATATTNAQQAQATATVGAIVATLPKTAFATPPAISGTPVKQPDGLQYFDIKVGDGASVASGMTIAVEYTGWLQKDGKKFDSSYDHGRKPVSLPIGQGQVIKGWDEGLLGVKVGGTRRLIIPPSLGYGAQGQPPVIPPNATLVFDVTVVAIQPTQATQAPSQ